MTIKKSDSLLKGAIADAKTVRETALANAKAALEEAFMPHLTSMLSAKLKNEAEDEEEDKEELDEAELHDSDATDGYGADEGGETDKEAISETTELDSSNVGAGDNKEPSGYKSADDDDNKELSRPMENNETGLKEGLGSEVEQRPMEDGENTQLKEDESFEDEMGDEEHAHDGLDIEEIIRELEGDAMGDEDSDDFDMEHQFGDEAGAAQGQPAIEPEIEEDDIADLSASPEALDASEDELGDMPVDQGQPVPEDEGYADGMNNDDELDLESIVKEIASTDAEAKDSTAEDGFSKTVTENKSLKGQLKEYREAVKFLRSKLLEVNLLNAKLLFTNKLFKNFSLDVGQKMRVVETFDRATTLRETKLVYTTLVESFRGNPKGRNGKKVVTEGLASRAIGSTKPKTSPASIAERSGILNEGYDQVARFKKLAGIRTDSK